MERLTEKFVCNLPDKVLEKLGIADIPKEDYEIKGTNGELCRETCEKYKCDSCPIQKAIDKLAKYEDAEGQGLLSRLPVAEGANVFCIGSCGEICDDYETDCEVCGEHKVVFCMNFDINMVEQFGKTVFLTKEQAEQALAEMKGV